MAPQAQSPPPASHANPQTPHHTQTATKTQPKPKKQPKTQTPPHSIGATHNHKKQTKPHRNAWKNLYPQVLLFRLEFNYPKQNQTW
jgi:hypothetical protein